MNTRLEMSESVKSIAPRLLELQHVLAVVKKEAVGQVGSQKTKYAPLDDCLREVIPKANALGLLVLQGAVPGEVNQVGVCTTILHAESGEYIGGTMMFTPEKAGPQAAGMCVTYGRRYGLALIGLLTDTDTDGVSTLSDEAEKKSNGAVNAAARPPVVPPARPTPPPASHPRAGTPATPPSGPGPAGAASAAAASPAPGPSRPAIPGSGAKLDTKAPNPAATRDKAISVGQDNRLHAILNGTGYGKDALMAYVTANYTREDGQPIEHTYDLSWRDKEYENLTQWIIDGGFSTWAASQGFQHS